MSLRPTTYSRYRYTTPIITEDGIETYGLAVPHQFLKKETLLPEQILQTKPITSELAGKLDLLAEEIYGKNELFWVFLMFNNIENPLTYPEIGIIVQYPSPDIVLALA